MHRSCLHTHTHTQRLFSPLWRCDPTRAMASSFLRFLDHTQRRITVGRTPLDEWSARRRDLYLTTHNTHNRLTSMPPVGFEPMISASERPQTYALVRAATGTDTHTHTHTHTHTYISIYIYIYIYIIIIIISHHAQHIYQLLKVTTFDLGSGHYHTYALFEKCGRTIQSFINLGKKSRSHEIIMKNRVKID